MTQLRQLTVLAAGNQIELLEELLFLADAQAVTLVDHGDTPILEPPVGGHPVWPQTQVNALFHDERPQSQILKDIAIYLRRANILIELPKELTPVPNQDWVKASLNSFKPIKVASFWIKPSWNEDPVPEDFTLLNLDPGLAFGTGMHPTTQLCLEWLSAHPPSGQTIMDFGCGSGILGIAAGCLGAGRVTGCDIDPQALIATKQNAGLNHLAVETLLPNQIVGSTYDLVIANILANPLIELASTLHELTERNGKIVLAGLLDEQADQVRAAYPAFAFDSDVSKEGWTRLSGTKVE